MYRQGIRITVYVILITALLLLAPLIDNDLYVFLAKKGIVEKDILYRTLGEARKVFSASAAVTADAYLHGGSYPSDFELLHIMEEVHENHSDDHDHDHDHGHDHDHDHGHDHGHAHNHEHRHDGNHHDHEHGGGAGRGDNGVAAISRLNILLKLGEIVNISRHFHLYGEEEKEVLPWIYYAVRLDPHNVNAYVLGGHWLGRRLNRPEEALTFLKEGIRSNPDAWQIYEEMGLISLIEEKDYEAALGYFMKAGERLRDDPDGFDRRRLRTFIAECYEKLGDPEKAERFRGMPRGPGDGA